MPDPSASAAALPSALARWVDLVVTDTSHRERDYLPPESAATTRAMTTRQGKEAVQTGATTRSDEQFAMATPWRHMSWRTGQRNRPGLEYLVSTRRHHAYESQHERRLLQLLDVDGRLVDGLAQPFLLTFSDGLHRHEHTPDYLARLGTGEVLLLNVKPDDRVADSDRTAFASADWLAAARGQRHEVVTGWVEPARSTVDALSAQRRDFHDTFGLVPQVRDALHDGPLPFGDVAAATAVPAVARAVVIALLWRRELTVDLAAPLGVLTPVSVAAA